MSRKPKQQLSVDESELFNSVDANSRPIQGDIADQTDAEIREIIYDHLPSKGGRPKYEMNDEHVFRMLCKGMTAVDVAYVYGCDPQTVRNRFPELIAKAASARRYRIHCAQERLLDSGNPAMAIYLGKVVLNQKESADAATKQDIDDLKKLLPTITFASPTPSKEE